MKKLLDRLEKAAIALELEEEYKGRMDLVREAKAVDFAKIDRVSIETFEQSWQQRYRASGVTVATTTRRQTLSGQLGEAKHAGQIRQIGVDSRLSIFSENYPDILRQIHQPPIYLYYAGDISLLSRKLLAIVGSRKQLALTKKEVARLIDYCKVHQLVTVSGLAFGVDASVHESSLAKDVPTIAVLPTSLADITPKANVKLARQILEGGGLLISEFCQPREYAKYIFPLRNRIIAGLAAATTVMQAGYDSGSLSTAKYAQESDREVFSFLGNHISESYYGNHWLVEAKLASALTRNYTGIAEVFGFPYSLSKDSNATDSEAQRYAPENFKHKQLNKLDPSAVDVCVAIANGHGNYADLLELFPDTDIMPVLAKLQLKGLVEKDSYGRFKALA